MLAHASPEGKERATRQRYTGIVTRDRRLRRIRILIAGFMAVLVFSGLTAFPLAWESGVLVDWIGQGDSALAVWLRTVNQGITESAARFPFLAYGTDWLAFGHLVIASAFIGPLREPVRNRWVIEFGLYACAAVPVLALIAGPIRGIPFWWQLIDCSFGVLGAIPLWFARRDVIALETGDDEGATREGLEASREWGDGNPAGQG